MTQHPLKCTKLSLLAMGLLVFQGSQILGILFQHSTSCMRATSIGHPQRSCEKVSYLSQFRIQILVNSAYALMTLA